MARATANVAGVASTPVASEYERIAQALKPTYGTNCAAKTLLSR